MIRPGSAPVIDKPLPAASSHTNIWHGFIFWLFCLIFAWGTYFAVDSGLNARFLNLLASNQLNWAVWLFGTTPWEKYATPSLTGDGGRKIWACIVLPLWLTQHRNGLSFSFSFIFPVNATGLVVDRWFHKVSHSQFHQPLLNAWQEYEIHYHYLDLIRLKRSTSTY